MSPESGHVVGTPAGPASGSSFYLGMRVLPKPRREAMYAVYGFCREVDDIADDGGPREARAAMLDAWRSDLEALFASDVRPRTVALAPHIRPFELRLEDFHAVVDGMQMDVDADIQAPDWATLDLYCDRVASAVGRSSARIFGLPGPVADDLAHHLGRALQLTNILRDLDEDATIDRLYLPREPLAAGGVTDFRPAAVLAHPALESVAGEVGNRAAQHFREADRIMRAQPPRLVRAPALMEAAYRPVLEATMARGFAAPRRRIGVNKLRLFGSLLRQFLR